MEFGKGTGELKATDEDGQDINNVDHTKITNLLAKTKWDNTDKFGEGDFALRLIVEDNKANCGKLIKTLDINLKNEVTKAP